MEGMDNFIRCDLDKVEKKIHLLKSLLDCPNGTRVFIPTQIVKEMIVEYRQALKNLLDI